MIDQINTNWNNQIRSDSFIAWSSFKMTRVCLFEFRINSNILDPVGFKLKIVECISIHCISTTLFINRIKCRWLIKYHSSPQQALYRITVQRWIFEHRRREFQLGIKYKSRCVVENEKEMIKQNHFSLQRYMREKMGEKKTFGLFSTSSRIKRQWCCSPNFHLAFALDKPGQVQGRCRWHPLFSASSWFPFHFTNFLINNWSTGENINIILKQFFFFF